MQFSSLCLVSSHQKYWFSIIAALLKKHPFQIIFALAHPVPGLLLPFLGKSSKKKNCNKCMYMPILIFSGSNKSSLFIAAFQGRRKLWRLEQSLLFFQHPSWSCLQLGCLFWFQEFNGLDIYRWLLNPLPGCDHYLSIYHLWGGHFPAWICMYPPANSMLLLWPLCGSLGIFWFLHVRATLTIINTISALRRLWKLIVHFSFISNK